MAENSSSKRGIFVFLPFGDAITFLNISLVLHFPSKYLNMDSAFGVLSNTACLLVLGLLWRPADGRERGPAG
jgi:hypothetical protein